MKTAFAHLFAAAFALFLAAGNSIAQNTISGTVKYRQTTRYNFATIFDGDAVERVKEYLGGSLRQEVKGAKAIYFTEKAAFYGEDPGAQETIPQRLQGVLARVNYMKPPQSELKRAFYDFEKNERTEQVDFMTRVFLVESEIEGRPWKPTNKMIKIQNHTCMSAELKEGEDSITAWFSPEIPISLGPDRFSGLPGLILAVERNGETVFMATSVDLTPPAEGALSKPEEGKKVTREEFDKIVEEKGKEYRETRGERRDRRR